MIAVSSAEQAGEGAGEGETASRSGRLRRLREPAQPSVPQGRQEGLRVLPHGRR